MDGGVWWAAVHGVAKSRTWLSDFTFTFHFHALEEEMATHSSVLAWRIPGTAGPGGLPSMGLHRVGHDWSDLAAAAEPDILECEVKWALESITTNKASGGDGIPVELFSNPERWCCESAALSMPANLENSAVAMGLEEVSFPPNHKERQCQRMLKLPHNCTHLTRQWSNAQNSPRQASTVCELWTSRCSSWF